MSNNQQVGELNTIERLSRRSTWLFILLALVAIIACALVTRETAEERANAAEINLAGKRRMLSQRVGLLASQLQQDNKPEYLAELTQSLDKMAAVHQALTQGDPALGIRPPRTAELRARYDGADGINASTERFFGLGRALIAAAEQPQNAQPLAQQLIAMSRGEYLNDLDLLVNQYQLESEQSTDTLRLFLWLTLLVGLSLLAISAFSVFRPLIRQLKTAHAKQASFQHRLVDAIEALDDAFALFDNEDRLILYNLRFTETFALPGEAVYLGITFRELIGAIARHGLYTIPEDRMARWLEKRMATHRRAEGTNEIKFTDGRWLRVTERHTQEGGTVAIWSDVSHLKQALIDADQANKAKSEFLARMSHELRTPLNAILGFAQVLLQGIGAPLNQQQQECASHILQGGRHLLDLINEVLDLSTIEAGQLSIEQEALPLAPVIRDCLTLVLPQAQDRKISLNADDAGALVIQADAKRLKQVLLNLLSNGIKYNRIGGQLSLSLKPQNNQLRITVTDTGHGIPAELASRVFQPFDRLGASNVEGTGIGLSITQRLVELMGGRIGFDTTPDVGTAFWIELEMAAQSEVTTSDTPASPQPELPLSEPQNLDAIPAPATEKAILALKLDAADEKMLRLVVSTLRDTRLDLAADHNEALKLLGQNHYDALVTDLTSHDDLLATACQAKADLPLILLSDQPPPALPDADKNIHWQSRPLKSREIARLLRKLLQ